MAARKVTRWFSAAYACLRGILQNSPEVVAEGLDNLLRARNTWIEAYETPRRVICLEAHGLYELARGVSPDLVSAFDVDRPLPWDRGFYEWARANRAPLKAVRLPNLPPDVRDAIVRLKRPKWLADEASGD
jgi:hypothetical protein